MSLGARVLDARRQAEVLAAMALLASAHRRDVPRTHPLPDLVGKSAAVIVDAVLATVSAAHGADEACEDPSCDLCTATIELASRYVDPTGKEWPDPVRRLLADTIDAELAARGAAPRWALPRPEETVRLGVGR